MSFMRDAPKSSRSTYKAPKPSSGLEQYTPNVVAPTPPSRNSYVPIPDRGHGGTASRSKMDPFEVRVRFTQLLANLNASVTSATKTAQYAIKYRDMDEDLHSCIIEQLERVSKDAEEEGFLLTQAVPELDEQSC